MNADVIVVGAGLAGLVATHELTSRGKKVALVDQENAANLGGQAFWSFGGLFLVDSPEQRRMGVKDSFELAWNDWRGSAGVRPDRRRGLLGFALGPRVRGVGSRGEAILAARTRRTHTVTSSPNSTSRTVVFGRQRTRLSRVVARTGKLLD